MLQQFSFQDRTVRVVLDDVATTLGYTKTNDAINTHCGGVVKYGTISDSLGRSQKMRVIYEPDLYRLIGATVSQVNKKLGTDFKWQPLQRYCENENILEAWFDVYGLDLNLVFGETL